MTKSKAIIAIVTAMIGLVIVLMSQEEREAWMARMIERDRLRRRELTPQPGDGQSSQTDPNSRTETEHEDNSGG